MNTHVRDNFDYLFNVAHVDTASLIPSALWQTTSDTFVDWNTGTPLTLSFAKRGGTETKLSVAVETTGFVTGGNSLIQFAIAIGGTDHAMGNPHYFNVLNDHRHMGEFIVIDGLAASLYTLKLRVHVTTGGDTFNIDGNDFAQITCYEVAA